MSYTLQIDANGKGDRVRAGTYRIIFEGTYAECLARKKGF